jgi:hypothetical protein
MENITVHLHYDGKQVLLDDKIDLPVNAKLLVTVIQMPHIQQESWLDLSAQRLDAAYADDEPEYSVKQLKERNPDYQGVNE